MYQGKFVVVEGLDGSGGTTQASLLRQYLQKLGHEAYLTKEPTDGPAGAMLRLALEKRLVYRSESSGGGSLADVTLALLFAADRMDHLFNDVVPKLELGIAVVSDRYYLSSYAYQGDAADLDWLRQINAKCVQPDLTIFLDVPVEICLKRMQRERWEVHIFEEVQELERVRQSYLSAIDALTRAGEPIATLDGTGPVQAVHRRIANMVRRLWNTKPKREPTKAQLAFTDP